MFRACRARVPLASDTVAEVIAEGDALVRSRMAVEKGEVIRFLAGVYASA